MSLLRPEAGFDPMAGILRIFIGYDAKEPIAFSVLSHSILRRASIPISITPLVKSTLTRYHRAKGPTESTDFSMTRFLVPYLCDYQGWAVFMDCDMLVQCDIADLLMEMLQGRNKAALVCQHDYTPKPDPKFLGQIQTSYPRKNWSSFMVFNAKRCVALTPDYVNTASGLELHRFSWLRDHEIGGLPLEWNHLVNEYEPNPEARVLHFTRGGPWFSQESMPTPEDNRWVDERDHMYTCAVPERVG